MRFLYLIKVFQIIFVLIFFTELFSLYFFSKLLHKSLAKLFYLLTRSQHKTVGLLAFVFLPGTIVHELSHVIAAGSMLVESGEIEFMPEIRDDGIKLGSAQIHKTDPIRRALIGVAPVLIGTGLVVGISWYLTFLQFSGQGVAWWVFLIMFYLIFEISNTMFSSSKDLEGSLVITVILVSIIIAFYYLRIFNPVELLQTPFGVQALEIIKKANLFLLIPIIMDVLIFGIVRIFIKRSFRYIS